MCRNGNALADSWFCGERPRVRPMTTSESSLTESPCPSEWRSRSLARLVAHLSDQYRSPTELCLDALSDLFFRPKYERTNADIAKSTKMTRGALQLELLFQQLQRACRQPIR